MSYLKSYKRLNKLIENESFEPSISWGFRMAISGTAPMVWGIFTGRIEDATWIALTAEAISWVEMKGAFGWRVRTLLAGALLAIFFSVLGTITGASMLLSVLCMFGVGFLSTLLKNVGDRASGLAICVYLLFIICNAYPARELAEIEHRLMLIGIGAAWPVLVGIVVSALQPAEEPFRRQIALIWRSISSLVETVSKSGIDLGTNTGELFAKENEVRAAIDKSFEFYGDMAHQVKQTEHKQYQLAQIRKIAGMVGVNVIAMSEEMAHIAVSDLDEPLRVKAATLFSALKDAVSSISIFIISLEVEEKLQATAHLNRLRKLITLIGEYPMPPHEKQSIAIRRILQLAERTLKLMDSAIQRIEHMGEDKPVYRSYSFANTMDTFNLKQLSASLRLLFNFNTFNTRYALRSAIAATAALFIYKWFHIDHGYWLPFSVMIIIQPYFGATFKRSIERVAGTLLGGFAGSLLLHLPTGLYLKEAVLFATFILMVYFLRKHYAIAAAFITLNLVLLFNLQSAYNNQLMIERALSTAGGALLAVVAGFLLLPTWDKKWLPSHLAAAIRCNYDYFIATFFSHELITNWTKHKRSVESKNSNVFDSFKRYMQEPGKEKSELYYDLITYNVRVTRDLNNIHLEEDEKKGEQKSAATMAQQERVNEAYHLFNKVIAGLKKLDGVKPRPMIYESTARAPFYIDETQMVSLEKLIIELKSMLDDLHKLNSAKKLY